MKKKYKTIIYNVNFGGFGLSPFAEYEYLKRKLAENAKGAKAPKIYVFNAELISGEKWRSVDPKTLKSLEMTDIRLDYYMFSTSPDPEDASSELHLPNWYNYDTRKDPILIKLLKQYGSEKISGNHATLATMRIPANSGWDIFDYDGRECVICAKTHKWRY